MSDHLYTDTRFTIGRVIGRTFGVIGRSFGTVTLLSLLAYAVGIPLKYGVNILTATTLQPGPFGGWLNAIVTVFRMNLDVVVPYAFLAGGLTNLAFNDEETRPSLGQSFRNAFRFLLPLLLVSCIVALGISVGFILLVVPAIFAVLIWFVALPVRVIEGPGWRNALSRSAALTKGHRWELFALLVLFMLAIALVFIPIGFVGYILPHMHAFGLVSWLTPVTMIMSSLIGAINMVGRAVTYTELRRATTGGLPTQVASVFE